MKKCMICDSKKRLIEEAGVILCQRCAQALHDALKEKIKEAKRKSAIEKKDGM